MRFNLNQSIEILQRTPKTLRQMLGGLGEEWTHANYGEKTFSPFDVVGHLVHGERTDWIPRAKIILEHGQTRAFDSFDRYAMYKDSTGKTLDELLDAFETLRKENIESLRAMNLTVDQLQLKGAHPELGTVTLEALLATWPLHDLNHIAQIAKSMAYQYKASVDPWRAYISVLNK